MEVAMPSTRSVPWNRFLLVLATAGMAACSGDSKSPTDTNDQPVTIELTAPAGGTTLQGTVLIQWQSRNATTETVTIRLSDDSGSTWGETLATGQAATGSWSWDVSGKTDGSTYRIRVEVVNAAQTVVASASSGSDLVIDNPAVVQLLSPLGGEVWSGVQSIEWQSDHAATEMATIRLSANSGESYGTVVATGRAHTGTYDWDMSGEAAASTYRIRVELLDASQTVVSSDESGSDFAIEHRLKLADIAFADANLQAAVLATGKTYADEVTVLHADQLGITDITGIERLTSLTELELDRNSIVDLSPLSGLTGLTDLNLSDNPVSDITALAGLTDLQILDLDDCAVSDLSSLSGLVKLTDLEVARNQVASFAPLASLTALIELSIGTNPATDLSPLTGLNALTYLHASYIKPVSLAPVGMLTNLEVLFLQGSDLTDIGDLAGLVKLKRLMVPNNDLTSLAPVSGMTQLEELAAFSNGITSTAPLAGLTGLVALRLSGNPITDFSGIPSLVNLRTLNLAATGFSNLGLLAGMAGLEELFIGSLGLTDAGPLAQFTELRSLWAGSNSFTDLTPLAGLQHLKDLDIRGSAITDVSPLASLTTLQYVYAKDNAITTGVASLVSLVNAKKIELVGNNLIPCADLDSLDAALGAGVVERPTTCS
jgi:Leucine-rich repeat (LRR) protein